MKKLVSQIQKMTIKEIVIYSVLIIFLIWLLKRSKTQIKAAFSKLRYDLFGARITDGSNGVGYGLTQERKAVLDGLAKDLHDSVYAWLGTAEEELATINALPDNEFIYCYESYITQFQANPYYDVDNEWLPGTDEDEKFMNRATKLNLPIA